VHVARLSDSILRELQASAPVDLEMVASYQGIGRVIRCELPHGGCLITDPASGRMEIRLRATDHPYRQRFSGFHEIAHTFMPGYQLQMQWRCEPSEAEREQARIEALCDAGASELLLPSRLVRADLVTADFGLPTVRALADSYQASLQASAHRLVDLWPEDALLVVAQIQQKPSERGTDAEPVLRVSYSRPRGRWPFIKRFKSVSADHPLSRALLGELVDEHGNIDEICDKVENVQVSARLCPYTDQTGARHDRVLALYRRPRERV
jgi:hypothetical protein